MRVIANVRRAPGALSGMQMDRTRRVKQHTWAGNSPDAWRSSAGDLLASATVLRERRGAVEPDSSSATDTWRLHPVELMLRGMAIECLLKALWVKGGNKLVKDGKYIGVHGAGDHRLVQLAGVLRLRLSNLEKDLFVRLQDFIEYGGRYPVPKDADTLRMIRDPRGGKGAATSWHTPSDQDLYDAIVDRLEKHLDETSA